MKVVFSVLVVTALGFAMVGSTLLCLDVSFPHNSAGPAPVSAMFVWKKIASRRHRHEYYDWP